MALTVLAAFFGLVALRQLNGAGATPALHPISAHPIKIKCTNDDPFFYATPGSKCTSYYQCLNGLRKYECPAGAVFNFYKQMCTKGSDVCYEPTCIGREHGPHADTTHACRRSFACRDQRATVFDNCPRGHLYNGNDGCQPQDSVECDQPDTTAVALAFPGDRRCAERTDGAHLLSSGDHNEFIVCDHGAMTEIGSCPLNYTFNVQLGQCAALAPTPLFDDCDADECAGRGDGFFADPLADDCRTYLKCMNSAVVARLNCGAQAVFNGETCVPTPLYFCRRQGREYNVCHKQEDGLHLNAARGCAHFVRCTSGRIVDELQCAGGHVFDTLQRTCTRQTSAICREPHPSNECRNQFEPGYYPDRTAASNCRAYFFCLNGNKTELWCPRGWIFDGERCVDEHRTTFTCPSLDQNSCDTKADGYYRDRSGGCRAYYFCSAGKKFTFLCAEGEVFDGTKCMKKRSGLNCGREDCHGRSDGYHQDLATHCRSYFLCLRGEKVTALTCRGSRLFNGDACVEPTSYVCPSLVADSAAVNCVQRQCPAAVECRRDGFFTNYDAGCRAYHFCIAGKKTSLTCSGSQLFNGEFCVPADTYQCPKYCVASSNAAIPIPGKSCS